MPDKLHAALERHTGTDGGLCVFCGGRPCDAARALAEIERLEAALRERLLGLDPLSRAIWASQTSATGLPWDRVGNPTRHEVEAEAIGIRSALLQDPEAKEGE